MPATRTAAQAEAARRNGRHSRGPATPEGKARASRNALKHGLAAARHLLLEGEDHATYEQLLTDLVQDLAPATELEAQLVRRLAATLWKQERADRLETDILADQPKHDLAYAADHHTLVVNPAATIQLARFNALRAYQAQLGREASRLLRELRLLRQEALATVAAAEPENEPEPVAVEPPSLPEPAIEAVVENEPEPPTDALDAAAMIATGEPLKVLAAARYLGMEDEVQAYFQRQEATNSA
jgi:hypothetical protein